MVRRGSVHQRRKKNLENRNQDRISELPNELIIRILSSLEMKDSVKTGTLSKRWRNVWNGVDNVVYIMRDGSLVESRNVKLRQFMSFIDNTLMQCTSPSIKSFTLAFDGPGFCFPDEAVLDNDEPRYDLLEKRVKYIMLKNVESLKLEKMGFYHPPDCMYQSSSLIKLKIELWDLGMVKPSRVSWTTLKILSLSKLWLRDDLIEHILGGCPVLKTLALNDIMGLKHLNIVTPSIKELILCSMHNYIDYEKTKRGMLKIRAPWIKALQISGKFSSPHFQLVDGYSVEIADLTFFSNFGCFDDDEDELKVTSYHSMYSRMVIGLLKSLCNVVELLIESLPIQVFSLFDLLNEPRPLFKCKYVRVISPLWKYDLPGIASLLASMPNLETLVIEVSNMRESDFPLKQNKELFSNNNPHLSLQERKFMNLKNVKIDYSSSFCDEVEDGDIDSWVCFDSELVGYILSSAVVLDKLIICSSAPHCEKCNSNCKLQHLPTLSSELMATLQAESESTDWELHKEKFTHQFIFSKSALLFPED